MYDKQRVIDIALAEVGYHEVGNNYTKYAADLDAIPSFYNGAKNGYAWCDVFVDWCFVKAYGVVGAKELLCQPDNSCGAGCYYSAKYFKDKGRFHEKNPQTGDQIFFSYQEGEVSHTGIVVGVTSYSVITVEGNTSDMVAKRSYALSDSRIFGYGRPDWGAQPAENEPNDGNGVIIVDPPVDNGNVSETPTNSSGGNCIQLPTLKRGDGMNDPSEVVRSAQMLLNGHDANVGRWGCDGEFGAMTEAAVMAYQRRNGMTANGIISKNTWSKLLGI